MQQANLQHGLPSTASLGRLRKLTDQSHSPASKRQAQLYHMCWLAVVLLAQHCATAWDRSACAATMRRAAVLHWFWAAALPRSREAK